MMHKRPIIPLHEVANLAAHGMSEDDDDEATGTNSDSSIPSVNLSPQRNHHFLTSHYKSTNYLNVTYRNRPSMGPLRKNKRMRHEQTDEGEKDYKLWQSMNADDSISNLPIHHTPMLNSDRKKRRLTENTLVGATTTEAATTTAGANIILVDVNEKNENDEEIQTSNNNNNNKSERSSLVIESTGIEENSTGVTISSIMKKSIKTKNDIEMDMKMKINNNNNNKIMEESEKHSFNPQNEQSIQSPKRKPKKGLPGRKAKNKSHTNLRRNPRRASTTPSSSNTLHLNIDITPTCSESIQLSNPDHIMPQSQPGPSSTNGNTTVSSRKRGSSKTPRVLDPSFIDNLFKCSTIANDLDIYWTKVKGHPYWPSQIVELTNDLEQSKRFKDALRWRKQGDNICVMYFGTSEVAYANFNESCLSWEEGLKRDLHLRQMHRYAFHDSLREVVSICQRIPIYPENWWNQPKWHSLMLEFYNEIEQGEIVERLEQKVEKADRESICWVKLRGFPHWPVQMMPPHIANQQYPGLKKRSYLNPGNSSAPCMFFGTGEVAMIPDRLRVSFGAGLVRGYHRCSERRDFLVALGEVWGFLKNPRYWPEGGNNDVEWWCKDPNQGREMKPWKEVSLHFSPPYEQITKSVRGPINSNQNGNKNRHRPEVHRCVCPNDPSGPCCSNMQCLNWASRFFCDSACGAKHLCGNLTFNMRKGPRVQPFMTTNCRGWGLRLEEPIKAGDFIIEYVGEIIDEYELEARLDQARKDRCHEYYTMDLENEMFIDATRKGNSSRFINSSCEPNCDAQKWTDPRTGETRIGVFALKTMPAGTELTYNYCFKDYGLQGEKQTRSFHCRCGTASCCMLSPSERELAKILIGKKLTVKWDDGWYPGIVKTYNTERKRFQVEYEDGDVEYLLFEFQEQHENPIPFIADDDTEQQLKVFRGELSPEQASKKKKPNPK